MERASICRESETKTIAFEWGSLTWFANAELGNSTELTVGRCILKAGAENPLHMHPNCSEVLVVLEGMIEHVIEDGRTVVLNPGDCINLPRNLPHRARNFSASEDAVLLIAFSSAYRETVEVESA